MIGQLCDYNEKEICGRILFYLNGINYDIIDKPELILNYIMFCINQDIEKIAYENYMSRLNMIMASNSYCENPIPFSDIRRNIYHPEKIDTRTAKEIIDDTLRKHNIKMED